MVQDTLLKEFFTSNDHFIDLCVEEVQNTLNYQA